jgi:hypothetical protein
MDKYYRKVPAEKQEQLRRFRQEHQLKLVVNGIAWEYLSTGDQPAAAAGSTLRTRHSHSVGASSSFEQEKFHLIAQTIRP